MEKKFGIREMHLFSHRGNYFMFLPVKMELYELAEEQYIEMERLKNEELLPSQLLCENGEFFEELLQADILTEEGGVSDACASESEEKPGLPEEPEPYINNIVLQVANDCNLNCLYCYGSGGSYDRERELMTWDVAKQGIDYLVERSEEGAEVVITFFGGEPLLNVPVIRKSIEYCKELAPKVNRKFRYSMTTNGTIFSEEIAELIRENRIHVMVSMDGGKCQQDRYRCYADGSGSYDVIRKNIDAIKEANGGQLSARATVCGPDIDVIGIKKALFDAGFTNAHLSLADVSRDSELRITEAQMEEIAAQYETFAEEYIEDMLRERQNNQLCFTQTIEKLFFKQFSLRSCSAGKNGHAVGSNGKVYPCQRFMGMDDYGMGTIYGEKNEKLWVPTVLEKDACRNCWARFLCGGGCMYTFVNEGGSVNGEAPAYCTLQKRVFELGLYCYSMLKKENESFFQNRFTPMSVQETADC